MWQSADTFDRLRVPEGDRNVLLSFHFYTPMPLTHYGAGWTKVGRVQGPGALSGRGGRRRRPRRPARRPASAPIGRHDATSTAACSRSRSPSRSRSRRPTGLPLYCGEWGALPVARRGPTACAGTPTCAACSRSTASAGRPGTTRAASASSTGQRKVDDGLAAVLLGAPGRRADPLGGPRRLRARTGDVGDVALPGATVFDASRGEYRLTARGREHLGHGRRVPLRLEGR